MSDIPVREGFSQL